MHAFLLGNGLHGALLLLRRNFRLFLERLFLEFMLSFFLSGLLAFAYQYWIINPLKLSHWTVPVAVLLIAFFIYLLADSIIRAGTYHVFLNALNAKKKESIVFLGMHYFIESFVSLFYISLSENIMKLGVFLTFILSIPIVQAYSIKGAFFAALILASLIILIFVVRSIFALCYSLAILDGCLLDEAYTRLMRVISIQDKVTKSRVLFFAVSLLGLSASVALLDNFSQVLSFKADDMVNQFPTFLLLAPIVSSFYTVLIDLASMIFVLALTDRLPLGIASLLPEQSQKEAT